MSLNYKGALRKAEMLAPAISDLRYAVTVIHEEGTVLHYNPAVAVDLGDGWVAVLPEHHELQVHHDNDALVYMWSREEFKTWDEIAKKEPA